MLLLLLYLFGALALVVEDEGESADIWRNVVEAELLLPDGVGRALHLTPPHFHTPVVLHFDHWVLAALERQLGALYQPDGQLPNFPSPAPALQRPLCPVLTELEQSLRPLPLDVTAFGAQVVNSRQTRDTCYLKGRNTCVTMATRAPPPERRTVGRRASRDTCRPTRRSGRRRPWGAVSCRSRRSRGDSASDPTRRSTASTSSASDLRDQILSSITSVTTLRVYNFTLILPPPPQPQTHKVSAYGTSTQRPVYVISA